MCAVASLGHLETQHLTSHLYLLQVRALHQSRQIFVDFISIFPPPASLNFSLVDEHSTHVNALPFEYSLTVPINLHLLTSFVDRSHCMLTLNLI